MTNQFVSHLPVMEALREVHLGKPLRLWGPNVKPKSVVQTGQRAAGGRMGVRFAKALAVAKPLVTVSTRMMRERA